jgi:hypothetical protein
MFTAMPTWYSPNRVSVSTSLPRPKSSVAGVGSESASTAALFIHSWYWLPAESAFSESHSIHERMCASSLKKEQLKTLPDSSSYEIMRKGRTSHSRMADING